MVPGDSMDTLTELVIATYLSFLSTLGFYDNHKTEKHYSTIFAQEGDKWAGGKSLCLGRRVLPTDNIIAHRKWRCGTWVLLYNPRTERETISRVGDHGPYGACIKKGWIVGDHCPREYWRVKRKRGDPGIWRGGFDLTPHVAKELGHNGFEPITLRVIHRPKKTRKPRRKYMTKIGTADAGAQAKKAAPKKKKLAVKSAAAKKPKGAKAKAKPAKKKAAAVRKVTKSSLGSPEALEGVFDNSRYEMDSVVSRVHVLAQSLAQLAVVPTGTTGFGTKNSLDKSRDSIAAAIDKQLFALNALTKKHLPWDTKAEINEVIGDNISARDIAQQVDAQIAADVLPAAIPIGMPVPALPLAPTTSPIPIPTAQP